MEWRSVTSRYHGSKNFWISTKRRAFALAKDGRIVWNTFFFLSAVKHRKVIHFKASVFPPYLQLHGLLRSRNFATVAITIRAYAKAFLSDSRQPEVYSLLF